MDRKSHESGTGNVGLETRVDVDYSIPVSIAIAASAIWIVAAYRTFRTLPRDLDFASVELIANAQEVA